MSSAHQRPRTRGECPAPADGPCPWVSCRHHLAIGINQRTGQLVLNPLAFADDGEIDLWPLYRRAGATVCSLDLADREPWEREQKSKEEVGDHLTLETIGALLGITRERTRQIELVALRKLKGAPGDHLPLLLDVLGARARRGGPARDLRRPPRGRPDREGNRHDTFGRELPAHCADSRRAA